MKRVLPAMAILLLVSVLLAVSGCKTTSAGTDQQSVQNPQQVDPASDAGTTAAPSADEATETPAQTPATEAPEGEGEGAKDDTDSAGVTTAAPGSAATPAASPEQPAKAKSNETR